MLRIRIGQHWKHEGAAEALDGFGLELDGMALVPGASEEPLGLVMDQLLLATAALGAGQTLAQVSLPESSQELLLVRHGEALELHVLRLGRPAGAVRPPVRLEAEAWRRAVVRAARGWISDLRTSAAPARLRQRARSLLSSADRELPPLATAQAGLGLRVEPRTTPGFRLLATDVDGLLGREQRRAQVPIAVLALPGRLELVSRGTQAWEARGPTGLLLLELLRQAEEVVRALEAGERTFCLSPTGASLPWQLDVQGGTVTAPGWTLAWRAEALAEAMVAPSLALSALLPALDARLLENRYLTDFTTRGRAVLAALRAHVATPAEAPRAPGRRARRPPALPLQPGAQVRRLGFLRRGHAKGLAGEGETELRTLGQGFVLVGRTRAAVVTREGEVLRRWVAREGLSLGPSGETLLASETRWLKVQLDAADARWFRDHDGAGLEGPLLVTDEHLVLTTRPSGVRALDRFTGRELWRFLPQRPRRLHLALHSGRVLVTSESGSVHGLDVAEGNVRFRLTTSLPCLGPCLPWGRSAVAMLGRGERMGLLVLDPRAGTARFERELSLSYAASPLARGQRLRLLGQRDSKPVLLALGPKGATQWEAQLPVGPGPWTLHADGEASLVTSADGSAVRVDAQGRVDWRLGGQGASAVASAVLERQVLLVPGETVRAVEARSGRVVAEIPSPGGLHALCASERLDVAVLDAAGDLTVWNLGASLGVVDASGA
jgi:PQQ-like domain